MLLYTGYNLISVKLIFCAVARAGQIHESIINCFSQFYVCRIYFRAFLMSNFEHRVLRIEPTAAQRYGQEN